MKYAHVRERDVRSATHIVVSRKGTTTREMKRGNEFVVMERCMEETRDLPLSLWGEQSMVVLNRSNFISPLVGSTYLHFPPSSLCTLTTFTLPHLKHVWTAHTATVSSCPGVKGGLLLPWFPHTPLLHDNDTGLLIISLSMQVGLVPFHWNQEWKHNLFCAGTSTRWSHSRAVSVGSNQL